MSGWRESQIGDEIELAYGKSLPAHARETGAFNVYGSNGCVGSHSSPLVSGPGIVVGRKGSVGKVVYSQDDFWPIDTTYYVVNKNDHNWRFLYHLLSCIGLDELNSHSAIPGLNREIAYSVPISLPDKTEQERVASVLDTIERGAQQEASAIDQTQELKSAAMRMLFTWGLRGEAQKETEIGPVPESWELRPIGEFAHQLQYGLSVRGEPSGRYPILRMNCQQDGKVLLRDLQFVNVDDETAKAYRVKPGDILFNRTNSYELVGRTAIVEIETNAVFASYLVRVSVDNKHLDPRFLNHFLNWDSAQAELKKLASRGVSQANISAGKLREFGIPLTDLDEQREIVAILDAIDRKIDLHRRKRTVLDDLFKALLHKLMTGEIRVGELGLFAMTGVKGSDNSTAIPIPNMASD